MTRSKSYASKKITTIYGTNDIVEDVKQVYLEEFEEARIEYNAKTRTDRQIKDYFQKVCDSQNDIACEIIIELGDIDFWQDKDNEYRFKMTDVYNEQIQDLSKMIMTQIIKLSVMIYIKMAYLMIMIMKSLTIF